MKATGTLMAILLLWYSLCYSVSPWMLAMLMLGREAFNIPSEKLKKFDPEVYKKTAPWLALTPDDAIDSTSLAGCLLVEVLDFQVSQNL